MRNGYSEHALSQHIATIYGIDKAIARLIEPLEISQEKDSCIHMVDLGAADGVNSFPVIARFANALEAKTNQLNLQVSHIDLPSVDFYELCHNIFADDRSYINALSAGNTRIHSAMVPGSYYRPFLPERSADILFSTTALHYASRHASILKRHVIPVRATAGAEKEAWEALSLIDLNTALTNIHGSLRSGGKFWAIVPAVRRDSLTGAAENFWYREVLDIMSEQLLDLVDQGVLDTDTWNNFVVPAHHRSSSQWQQWFSDHESMFQLDYIDQQEHANPYLDRFKHRHRDPKQFADEYLASIRAWGEKIITQLLPDQQRRERFFAGLHRQFMQTPERFDNDSVSVYIGATRL